MPFDRPTLRNLADRAISDINLRMPGSDARLRFSFENAVAWALAGLAHGLHGHLLFLSKQLLPDTGDANTVKRWATIVGVTPNDPEYASGTITVTGTNGTSIPSGTLFARVDGVEFATDAVATVASGSAEIAVTAVELGSDGNTEPSSTLSIVSPISNLDPDAVVGLSGLTGGAEAESTDALRARVLARMRQPALGGGAGDYVNWALEVDGVTRAWEVGTPGYVTVYFAVDGESSIIPSPSKVAEVQSYINGLAPITATVTVVAPVAAPLDPTISVTPDTAEVRSAVESELEAFILRAAEPGATLLLSQINEAISIAAGETDHTVTLPAANVTHAANELPTLGTITWA
jgi:uncharacterized phage protein gp47/JayE